MEVGTLILRVTSQGEKYFGITGRQDGSDQWYRPFNIAPQFGDKNLGKWQVLGSKEFVEWRT